MKRSSNRILTTHAGSIPRPREIVDTLRARQRGESIDQRRLAALVSKRLRGH